MRDLTGYEMRPYFRPPYGDYDEATLSYLYDNGYSQTIWWTCDTRGWAGWGARRSSTTARPTLPKMRFCSCMLAPPPWETSKRSLD